MSRGVQAIRGSERQQRSMFPEWGVLRLPTKRHQGKADMESVIVEIRAGSGGKDAQMFANELLRAYLLYAKKRKWKTNVTATKLTDMGLREAVVIMKGIGVISLMGQEGGTHQIQRVPPTERNGRVHSSTCTVAVLPLSGEKSAALSNDELKVTSYKSSGPGGQNTQKNDTAIRITHIPTGISASSESERSQYANKQNALTVLSARIQQISMVREHKRYNNMRLEQIGNALWSSRIRTYNMRHSRLVDHRSKYKTGKVTDFFKGNLFTLHEKGINDHPAKKHQIRRR